MQDKKQANKAGFTLIELIVSIAILAIISSIILANYKDGGRSQELTAAAQNLVSEIRKIQGYALGYKEFDGAIPDDGGWAIRLTSDSSDSPEKFILFFDDNNDGDYDSGSEDYLEGEIGRNVYVDDVVFNGADDYSYLSAIFYPPDPEISLNGSNDNDSVDTSGIIPNSVEIVLRHSSGNTKSLILNEFGLVDVD